MTVSPYFNNFNHAGEQGLIEDLIIESIRIHGMNVYYLPKIRKGFDKIYGEDPVMEFNSAHLVEMYIGNVDSFSGDGSFFSKFNIEIRDQMTLIVSRKVFNNGVAKTMGILRPNEGDLIYFPLNKKIFRIQYADEKAIFFQFGTLQTYNLTCELYEYSNERLNTGIPEIDDIERNYSISYEVNGLITDLDEVVTDDKGFGIIFSDGDDGFFDPFSDNTAIQREADDFIDFSETNPFSNGPY